MSICLSDVDMSERVAYCTCVMYSVKRECQPDETISSSMIKRDQPSQQHSRDVVNVSLLIYFAVSILFASLAFASIKSNITN